MTKTLLAVLLGEPAWPPPVWLMRQAGRYLPEYRALRARAGDFITLCTTPDLAAEVTLQPVRRFGMDGAILFSDILMVPWALGQPLRLVEGEGPVLPPIRDGAALAALDPARVAGAITPILETVRRVRADVGDATLIGFAGGPFTVACYMVEGRTSRDHAAIRRMAFAEPQLLDDLIALLTAVTIDYLLAQIGAGAETVMLFDSWAGILSPRLFERYVTRPTRQIVDAISAVYPNVPVIGFPRLAGGLVASYAAATVVDCLAIDTGADLGIVARAVPDTVTLQGNLDPMALVVGGAPLAKEAKAILAALRGRPHVFNLGHGIVPETPPEHVAELVALLRAG